MDMIIPTCTCTSRYTPPPRTMAQYNIRLCSAHRAAEDQAGVWPEAGQPDRPIILVMSQM